MELENIKQNTVWNDAAESINSNFAKIRQKMAFIKSGAGGSANIDVDTAMSDTSGNAVANKVIKKYVDEQVNGLEASVNQTFDDIETSIEQLDNAVSELIATKAGAFYVEPSTDLFIVFTTKEKKAAYIASRDESGVLGKFALGGQAADIILDTQMSDDSDNAVANRIIKAYVDETTTHLADDIKGNPSTYIPLKTINGESIMGDGNIEIQGGGAEITFLEFEIDADTMNLIMAYEMSDGGSLGFDFKIDGNGNMIAVI